MASEKKPNSLFHKTLSGSMMIAGTTIGAGMLGIPLVTYEAGFLPAVLVTFAVWLYMMITGHLLTNAALATTKGSSFLSLTEHFLGKKSKWLVCLLFLFLYYCLMIAYFSAGAPFLSSFLQSALHITLPIWVQNLFFGLIFGFIVAKGTHAIHKSNIFLTLFMLVAYALLLFCGFESVQGDLLKKADFSKLWIACPILFSAFGFHNVIPSVTNYLGKDKKALRLSLILGTGIPFVVYILWQWLILGSLPETALKAAYVQGTPATSALIGITQNRFIFPLGQIFAFFSITTSLLGVSMSLIDFLKDALKNKSPLIRHPSSLTLLTYLPPCILATLNPQIFALALGVAGGFGEAILNGIIPAILAWKLKNSSKGLYLFCIFIGLLVIAFEIGNLV